VFAIIAAILFALVLLLELIGASFGMIVTTTTLTTACLLWP
jgi:hypothetical protein